MRAALLCVLLTSCSGGGLTIAMVEQNNSGQNGQATLADTADGLEIVITLRQAGVMSSQLSHLHVGRCDDVRTVVAGISPLSAPDGGATFEGDNVKFRQVLGGHKLAEYSDGGFVINVHDPRDSRLYVSCGEIK